MSLGAALARPAAPGPPDQLGPSRTATAARRPGLAESMPPLEFSLLELADRLLDRGVVLAGEATISVAGVDLVFLGLNAVLSSVETLERAGRDNQSGPHTGRTGAVQPAPQPRPSAPSAEIAAGAPVPGGASPATLSDRPLGQRAADLGPLAAVEHEVDRLQGVLPDRVDVDPEGVERGLAKLVLTLVELIRQLLERQAVRRMDGGSLSDEQVERMGLALERLAAKMVDLCRAFGVDPDELNINLGPLGDLI